MYSFDFVSLPSPYHPSIKSPACEITIWLVVTYTKLLYRTWSHMWLYNFHFVAHYCKGASHVHVSWFSGQKVNCYEILQEWWSTVSQISYCTSHLGKVSVTGFHIWRKVSPRKSICQLHSLLDRSLFPLPLTYNPSIKNTSCLRIHYLKYFPCSYMITHVGV